MKMNFDIEFYVSASGASPVVDFLDQLKISDPDDFASLLAGLSKLKNRQYHREPLSKSIGNGLFELRHVGKLNTRIFWFFVKGQKIVAVHGIRNKGSSIPNKEIACAQNRMKDWMKRTSP
jgi:phage-related protein